MSVRALAGKDTVIVWSGDLHGKITNKMVDNMNFFSTCKKHPHPDMNECLTDAVSCGAAIVTGESHPTLRVSRSSPYQVLIRTKSCWVKR